MEGLQRSAVSFRRQGSSGLIWDDKLLKAEIELQDQRIKQQKESQDPENKPIQQDREDDDLEKAVKDELKPIKTVGSVNTIERSKSNGGRAYRTGKVSPAIDPPSPKVSACGFCGGGATKRKESRGKPKPKSGKRRV